MIYSGQPPLKITKSMKKTLLQISQDNQKSLTTLMLAHSLSLKKMDKMLADLKEVKYLYKNINK